MDSWSVRRRRAPASARISRDDHDRLWLEYDAHGVIRERWIRHDGDQQQFERRGYACDYKRPIKTMVITTGHDDRQEQEV